MTTLLLSFLILGIGDASLWPLDPPFVLSYDAVVLRDGQCYPSGEVCFHRDVRQWWEAFTIRHTFPYAMDEDHCLFLAGPEVKAFWDTWRAWFKSPSLLQEKHQCP